MNRKLVPIAVLSLLALCGWFYAPPNRAAESRPATAAPAPEATTAKAEFPESWFFPKRPAALRSIQGKMAPALNVKNWIGQPTSPNDLKGKVIIIDFWATWCGPCMRSIPHNMSLVKKYGDRLAFIGVHESRRGSEHMPRVAKQHGLNYPVAVDNGGQTVSAYKVSFYPTYVLIDGEGIVRAAGLLPSSLDSAVELLLKEAPAPEPSKPAASKNSSGNIALDFFEGSPGNFRKQFEAMVADGTPPPLSTTSWMNSEPLTFDDLHGKVVLLDFWATWCGPCIGSIPKLNALQKNYSDDLVVIGVCNPRGGEKMAAVLKERGIQYAICLDDKGETTKSYKVNSFPDYYLIDRTGKLRIADCKQQRLEEAINLLINEKVETASSQH